jgi:hypothetical protein
MSNKTVALYNAGITISVYSAHTLHPILLRQLGVYKVLRNMFVTIVTVINLYFMAWFCTYIWRGVE